MPPIETKRTDERAAALSAIIAAAGSAPAIEDVLETVVRELESEASACFVYVLDDEGEQLVLRAASPSYAHLTDHVVLERGQGFAWLAVESRHPVLVERPESDPRSVQVEGIDEAAFGASLAAPLQWRDGAPIGAVTFSLAAPHTFDTRQQEFLASAASVVAVAVENARLYEEVRARARQQEVVARLGLRALVLEDSQLLMDELTGAVAETLGVEVTTVLELEPGGDSLLIRAGHGWPDGYVGVRTVGSGERSLAGYTLLAGEPVIALDVTADDRFSAPPPVVELGVASSLSVVVQGKERPFGALVAHSLERRRFTADDASFLQAAANVLAGGIERERALAALRESEERFRSVFESTSTAIAITSVPGGAILHANRAFEQLVGRPEAELIGATVDAFTHPDDLEQKKELFSELARGERETSRFENRYVHPDGSVVWGDLTGSIVRDAEGRPAAYVGVITDVTDRKRAEEALRRRDAILEAVGWSAARLLQAGSLAETANEVLERLGRAAGTSRAYLFENHPGPAGTLLASQRFEWVSDGISPQIDNPVLQNQPYPDEAREAMGAGVPFDRMISEFSGETRTELEQQDILSMALVPIFVADEWWGFVGFDECVTERVWSAAELDALRAAAGILGAAVERARIEGALRESEERFRSVFESTPMGIVIIDVEQGTIARANRAFEELVGRPESALRGKTAGEVTHPDDLARKLDLFGELVEGKRASLQFDCRYVRPDGSSVWGDVTGSIVRDAGGQPIAIVGLVMDITHRREAEQAVRLATERLAAVLEASPIATIAVDPDGTVTMWTAAAQRVFGWTPEEAIGRPNPTVPPDLREEAKAFREAVLEGKTPATVETRRQRKDGSSLEVRMSLGPMSDASGEVTGIVALIEDVSDLRRAENERRQLEAQIQQTQKLESLGVLAGGIAHDFNNLLMGMLGNAGLALLDLPEGTARERVVQVETAIQRAAELTHQLLAYAGKASFDVVPLALGDLVREMTHLLEVSIPKKVRLSLDVQAGVPAIEADPTQIRQVVMNLITNAAEAIGDREGVIAVRVGLEEVDRAELAAAYADPRLAPGPYVCLEVEDTGSGVDAEALERIFDPFYSTKFAGRGLGLAAVLGIVRSHRGAISAESKPGVGTRFRVLLPPSATLVAPAVREPAATDENASGTILVVDDEDAVRAVSKTILDRFGYDTLTARDGKEAVALFRERQDEIDLVLLDMTMPVMDGVEALRALRAVRPDVRVLLSSGHPESEAEDRLGRERPSGFIQKPYRPADLIEQVKAVLGR